MAAWLTLLLYGHVVQVGVASLTPDELAVFRQNDFEITDHGDTWMIQHHGVPDHGFDGGFGNNPNTPTAQNHSYQVAKVPTAMPAGQEGCVGLGAIGLAISGAAFFNPYTSGGYNAVEGDCQETFDHCNGHPAPGGIYHYHQLPACLYNSRSDRRDVLLGVAFDGYPIYGPMDESGRNLTSADLDKCHGHTYRGRYVYRITLDFPYIMSCYHGSLLFNQGPGNSGPGGGGGPPPPGGPPAGRQRREVRQIQHRFMYKRQLLPVTDCNRGEHQNWQTETCWAFCENPSTGDFDDCPHAGAGTTDGPTGTALRPLATTWSLAAICAAAMALKTFF